MDGHRGTGCRRHVARAEDVIKVPMRVYDPDHSRCQPGQQRQDLPCIAPRIDDQRLTRDRTNHHRAVASQRADGKALA